MSEIRRQKSKIKDASERQAIQKLRHFYQMVDPEIRKWLTGVPASDVNFIGRLKRANAATIKSALRDPKLTKTARVRMEQRLRALQRAEESMPF